MCLYFDSMFCDPLPLQLLSKTHFFSIFWNRVDLPHPIWTMSLNKLCFFLRYPLFIRERFICKLFLEQFYLFCKNFPHGKLAIDYLKHSSVSRKIHFLKTIPMIMILILFVYNYNSWKSYLLKNPPKNSQLFLGIVMKFFN